jgi:MFS family permease
VSAIGSAIQLIVIPLWVYERTGSALSTGFTFAVQFVPLVVLAPWAGHVVDRFDRRRLMILCELGAALTVGGLVLAVRADSVAAMYVLLPLLRVFNALTMPAYQAMAVALVPVEQRPKSATVMETVIGANNALAPLLGTALAAAYGYESVLLVNLASFVVGAALLLGVPTLSGRRHLGGVLRSTVTPRAHPCVPDRSGRKRTSCSRRRHGTVPHRQDNFGTGLAESRRARGTGGSWRRLW